MDMTVLLTLPVYYSLSLKKPVAALFTTLMYKQSLSLKYTEPDVA